MAPQNLACNRVTKKQNSGEGALSGEGEDKGRALTHAEYVSLGGGRNICHLDRGDGNQSIHMS